VTVKGAMNDVMSIIYQALDPGINNNLYRYYIMTEPQVGTLIIANDGRVMQAEMRQNPC
jgi:hypothetical protein